MSVNTAQTGLTRKEKKQQKKELTALFTDNTLEPAELAAKVSELVNATIHVTRHGVKHAA